MEKGVVTNVELADKFESAIKLHGEDQENVVREAPARVIRGAWP
jgi:hypothetical protein